MRKVMKNVILVLVLVWVSLPCFSNNVRLNGMVKVTDVTSGVATLELDLTWDNSWRDNFNWDAVWIFLKYKPASGAWSHVMLQDMQHTATNDYVVMNGKNENGKVVGVYVFPGKNMTRQHVSTKVTLKWACGSAYTKASFDKNQAFILAQGIEMVYVPYGAYYLGDGASANTLGGSDGRPLTVLGEGTTITLYQRASDGTVGTAVSNLDVNYPKGYAGFYVMKYETSQEQYVTFLNTLTKAQQETLLGASFLSALSPGRYIFGDTLQPSFRNGIILSGKSSGQQPYVFDNNLNGNNVYGENGDGQCIACNYMSLNDMLAYASWAGLRPMSELEYERACRSPFPQEPVAGEYVWNSNTGVVRVTGLNAMGQEAEVANTATCNVNSGNGLTGNSQGPVRCGLFARSTSTQTTAGATYWGVMEMAGNVRELVASVSHTSLKRTVNGVGEFSTTIWANEPAFFGVRGGSFAGADSLLRASDRSEMEIVNSLMYRDSTVGFRLTRTLDAGSVTMDPGKISLSGPLCPGIESTVIETAAASISGMFSNFPISYIWSYSINNGSTWTIIPEAMGNTLKYSAFESGKTYLFRRTAVCALGEASVQTPEIMAFVITEITASSSDTVNAPCSLSIDVTAKGSNLTYQWQKDGANITNAKSATYAKNPTIPSDAGIYVCSVSGECGTVDSKKIYVSTGGFEDGELTDLRDGQTYRIRKMPDGHWWMVENLRFGTCDASAYATYYRTTSVNQIAVGYYGVCIASRVAGAGHLYNWQAAMNHQDAYAGSNPSNNNSSTQWQGICPDGWHLPSDGSTGEFQQLYTSLCNLSDRFYPGVGAFEGVLGGHGDRGGGVNVDGYGYYWSSTWVNASDAYSMYCGRSVGLQYGSYKYYGFAVRCVKDY